MSQGTGDSLRGVPPQPVPCPLGRLAMSLAKALSPAHSPNAALQLLYSQALAPVSDKNWDT